MNTTIRHQALRRSVTLLGALALVSSALMASSAATFAAKADPVATPDGGVCQDLPTTDETKYRVSFDLTANKGRWVFVRGELVIGTDVYVARFADFTKWDKGSNLQLEADVAGGKQPATMNLVFGTRKDDELNTVSRNFCD